MHDDVLVGEVRIDVVGADELASKRFAAIFGLNRYETPSAGVSSGEQLETKSAALEIIVGRIMAKSFISPAASATTHFRPDP